MRSGLLMFLCACVVACQPEPVVERAYDALNWEKDVFLDGDKPFTGIATATHEDGKPRARYPMKNGRLHGVVQEWWDNGQLAVETEFTDGKRHGYNRYYDREGRLTKEQKYERDRSVWVRKH